MIACDGTPCASGELTGNEFGFWPNNWTLRKTSKSVFNMLLVFINGLFFWVNESKKLGNYF
jgi:hypothetical protein